MKGKARPFFPTRRVRKKRRLNSIRRSSFLLRIKASNKISPQQVNKKRNKNLGKHLTIKRRGDVIEGRWSKAD